MTVGSRSLVGFTRLGILLAVVVASGCLEETPPPPKGYVEDAGFVPMDAGLPPSDAPPPVGDGRPEDWVGTWQYVSGSEGVTCGGSFSVNGIEGYLLIKATGPDGLTVEEDGCTFQFALGGDTATKTPPGQACPKWAVPVIPVWTLTMQADGTLEERLGGDVSLGGQSCTIGGRATLRRQ